MSGEQFAGVLELQVVAACDSNGASLSGKRVFVTISFGKSCFKTGSSLVEAASIWKQKCFIPIRKYEINYNISIGLWQSQTIGKNKLLGKAEISLQPFIAAAAIHQSEQIKMAVKIMQDLGGKSVCHSAEGFSDEKEGYYTLVNGEFFGPLRLKRLLWEHYFGDYCNNNSNNSTAGKLFLASGGGGGVGGQKEIVLELFRTCERIHFPNSQIFDSIVQMIEGAPADSFPMQAISEMLSHFPIATQEAIGGEYGCVFMDFCPKCTISTNSPSFQNEKQSGFTGEAALLIHFLQCSQVHLDARYFTEENASRKKLTRYLNYIGIGAYSIGKHNGNILVQERATGKIIEEKIPIYIKLGLKFLYQHAKGFVSSTTANSILNTMTKRQGVKYSSAKSTQWINSFIQYHGIRMEDFQIPPGNFQSFNDFFYRKLRPGARKLCSKDSAIAVSPADCRILCYESIGEATEFWIKGANFTATNLLQDPVTGAYYEDGALAICRLAPQDYHRFHAPVDGCIWGMKTIDGALLTVNPVAVREQHDVFTENKRIICYIRSERFGNVAFVAVGATMVGSVVMTVQQQHEEENENRNGERRGGNFVEKFQELGYFAFGGSTVVLLFPKSSICFDEDLLVNSKESLETLVQVGDSLGTLVHEIRNSSPTAFGIIK